MKKQGGRVTIISRESDERTLDIAMLEAELRSRGVDVRVMSKLLTKDSVAKAAAYLGHVAAQEAAILASDVVVLDTYCIPASMIPHRSGTKVIQMWHALSAIKKFGWQTVGKEGGSSMKVARLMRMHHGYDYVLCPSDVTAKHFCEAFRVDEDKIVKGGLPRIDYIKSVAGGNRKEDTAKRILSMYPQLRNGKKTVLYAPTFRPGKAVDAESLIEAIDLEKYNVVVKLHPLYRVEEDVSVPRSAQGDRVVIYDEEFTSFDWLSVADVIISDYSSLAVEATLADKPLYIYAYDLEDYSRGTGLNVDFYNEPIAPFVFRDAKDLAAELEKDYDFAALHAFRDRYIDIDTEGVTERLADFIEGLI